MRGRCGGRRFACILNGNAQYLLDELTADCVLLAQGRGALYYVAQLADVSPPFGAVQREHGVRLHGKLPAGGPGKVLDEVIHQEGDVPFAAAQGRNAQVQHAEAVIEVLAKPFVADLLL